jgi:type II secretory pathway component PulJ
VATSPLAFAAYFAVFIAWTVVTLQDRRISALLRSLNQFPENDRAQFVAREMNVVLPRSISAEASLREKRQRLACARARADPRSPGCLFRNEMAESLMVEWRRASKLRADR